MKKTRCYIYTRVSTAIQVDGYSLDAQKDKLRKYAEFRDIQSRYGAEMSAVPNRRICSTVDSSIFTPNLSRTVFFAAIMHWFTPSFSVQHRLSCAFLLLIYRMFMVPFPISARRLVPLKFPRWFTIAGYPCG